MNKTQGEPAPDMQQGTPVEEFVKGDKEAQSKLPKVMQDAIKGKRSYHTSAIRRQGLIEHQPSGDVVPPLELASFSQQNDLAPKIPPGFKFEPPELPLPAGSQLQDRFDPLVSQFTNLIMQHGKKGVAQRVCLDTLRGILR